MMPMDTPRPVVTANAAESDAAGAGQGTSKGSKRLEGFTPTYEIPYEEAKPSTPELQIIIGFDAEWIEEPEEPSDDPDAEDRRDPGALPVNLVLSYQYACRFGGRE